MGPDEAKSGEGFTRDLPPAADHHLPRIPLHFIRTTSPSSDALVGPTPKTARHLLRCLDFVQ
jgi:hypothetical protein